MVMFSNPAVPKIRKLSGLAGFLLSSESQRKSVTFKVTRNFYCIFKKVTANLWLKTY